MVSIKSIIKTVIYLLKPAYAILFRAMPLKLLLYLAGMDFGKDLNHPLRHKILFLLLGGSVHLDLLKKVLKKRYCKMTLSERRICNEIFWQSGSSMQWAQRAFNDPQRRCNHSSFNLMVTLYKRVGRPVSVLELGCTNGGTLSCLQLRGVKVSKYCGVDISGDNINKAKLRFEKHNNAEFVKKDFIEYLNSTNDFFDILFVRWTFFYLDQEYLEELIHIISRKGIAKRILVSETHSTSHYSKQSVLFSACGVPLEYSHNYPSIFNKQNYRIENNSSREVKKGISIFEAVLIHSLG